MGESAGTRSVPSRNASIAAIVTVTMVVGIGTVAVRTRAVWFRKRFPYVQFALTRTKRPVWPPAAPQKGATAGGLKVLPEEYPDVKRSDSDFTESIHGTCVPDPYRWLEDPNSEETKQFIEAQNKLSQGVLDRCEGRKQIKELISAIMDHPKRSLPWKAGKRWYYFDNTGLQNQDVMFASNAPDGEATVFLDPNTLSTDGTVAMTGPSFTYKGDRMAYQLSKSGSDWKTIKVKAIGSNGEPSDLPDVCEYVRFSGISWTRDGKGFFYSRYDKPKTSDLGTETDEALNQKIFYHKMGTTQVDDVLLFAIPEEPKWNSDAQVTEDGRWLWLSIGSGCEPVNKAYVCDLSSLQKASDGSIDFSKMAFTNGKPRLPLVKLADTFVASWSLVAVEGSVLTIQTNFMAPRERLVALDMEKAPEGALTAGRFREIVPQHPRDLLQGATPLKGDLMVVQWMRDVVDIAELRQISDGALLATVPLPSLGTMSSVVTEPNRTTTEFWFSLTSFVEPSTKYRADAAMIIEAANIPGQATAESPGVQVFSRTQLKVPHDSSSYETKQLFVKSKDGTPVPMFVVHKRGVKLDGQNPTLLYGYGGFNVSLHPTFSASWLAWIKAFDGVFALANLRGGGEYGKGWRDDGSLMRKQNVFDDFHACASHLVQQGYCTPAKLTIQGGSNGGLLVATCANQRPDLYGVILAQVGVLDMLRFHKFTIGHYWRTDFGDPDDPDMFEYLLKYSPLHNIVPPKDGSQYPAMLLTTASHDDRVSPLHSFKHLAELQHKIAKRKGSTQTNPLIARIETNAGHGAGKPTTKKIEEASDMFAFAGAAMSAKIRASK